MLKPYTFLFYKGNSYVSKVIKKMTESKYSHVALVLDEYHVLETDWKFPVSIRHISYKSADYDIYHLNIELTERQEKLITDFIYKELSNKYDFKFLFTRWLKMIIGLKVRDDKNTYTCDDLIYEAFLHAGIRLVENKEDLSPQALSNSIYIKQYKK